METEMSWTASIIHELTAIAVTVLTPTLTYLGIMAARWFAHKTKIEVSKANEEQLADILRRSIAYAEEQGYKLAKHSGDVLTGKDKMKLAVEAAVGWLKQSQIQEILEEELQQRIEALVHVEALPAKERNGSIRPPVVEGTDSKGESNA